jgi:hypothetical protein
MGKQSRGQLRMHGGMLLFCGLPIQLLLLMLSFSPTARLRWQQRCQLGSSLVCQMLLAAIRVNPGALPNWRAVLIA